MDASEKLEEIFRQFPGIGPRQAKRFVYHLLTKNQSELLDFSNHLLELKGSIAVCPSCFRFFPLRQAKPDPTTLCSICKDPNRDHSKLMVVARDIDLQAIEKSRAYDGKYFVLGGTVPILDSNPELRIRQKELIHTISGNQPQALIAEIILATSVNPEGEYTATYLTSLIRKQFESPDNNFGDTPKITTLGRGLSTGTELEYSDADTLRSALENRRSY
jgi:recombination protein RecR